MQVTIAEAAQILRLSERTIRRRLQVGELTGSRMASPGGYTWMVDVPDGAPIGETDRTNALIARLEKQIEAQAEELEARRREVQELHVLLQQAQAALPAPREGKPWWRRVWGRG
jgi:hypothetical protein